jgi:hypothetical protein
MYPRCTRATTPDDGRIRPPTIFTTFSKEAMMGERTLAIADADAKKIVNQWVWVTGSVSWVPGSTFVLSGLDMKLYSDVAHAYQVTAYSVEGVIAAIAGGLTGRGFSELLSFAPPIGWIVKAGIAAGVTKAIGEIVIQYMRERSPLTA